MPQPAASLARGRSPRPWWFRLGGWVVALVLVALTVLVVIDRGSYGATEHSVAAVPAAPLTGEPAATVTLQSEHDAQSYLAGPVVAQVTEHGVVARAVGSDEELWRYVRTDTEVCAHRVNAQHITLIYAAGDRCAEAVSLSPGTGARQWQRTIEAVQPNEIVWGDGSFISLDPAKTIYYEDTQGFERFTLDNSRTDHIEGEHTSCENLDAAGSPLVATLQRCRAQPTDPWVLQVVLNEASDGEPRETGRSYLGAMVDPSIDGVAPDGTTVLRDAAGVVHVLPPGASEPVPLAGMPAVAPDQPLHVVAPRGAIVLSTASTAHELDPSRTSVASVTDIVAAPYGVGPRLYLPNASGVEERDTVNARTIRTIGWQAGTVAPAELVVHGPLIAVRDAAGLRVYS